MKLFRRHVVIIVKMSSKQKKEDSGIQANAPRIEKIWYQEVLVLRIDEGTYNALEKWAADEVSLSEWSDGMADRPGLKAAGREEGKE
jgi:hypothetical protein